MSAQTAGRETSDYMFDRVAECMPRNELKAQQLSRLKSMLDCAYNKVPHYKKKFDAAKIKPGDLKSLSDLARFPFTVKTDLRDNYPFGMFAVPRDQMLRLHASSGTTGKPTVVGYTKADLNLWADLMARCLACMGARPGEIVHNAYGYGLFTGGLRRALRRRAARLHGSAAVGRRHRAAGHAAAGLRRADPVRDAVLRAQYRRSRREHGRRYPQAAAAHRHLRRRALDRRHAARHRVAARHPGGRHLRPVGDHGAGRRLRMPADEERPARLGGSLPVRDRRSRHHAAEADGGGGRSW